MKLAAVVLAAGQGTRMKSALPKVLHPVAGVPMVQHSLASAAAVTDATPVLVVGHGSEQVRAEVGDRARYALQEQQLGTGHAVRQAESLLREDGITDVLVTYADMPLLRAETLQGLVTKHSQSGATITMLTVALPDPHGFGRVVRDDAGRVVAIVEESDCTPTQRAIRELNAGMYCFKASWLWPSLAQLRPSPKGEYYLTDLVGLAVAGGEPVADCETLDPEELLGINTRVHLAEAEAVMRRRINVRWMEDGVTMVDPATTYIAGGVTIGADTTILPQTHLSGATTIGARCRIGPGTVICDSQRRRRLHRDAVGVGVRRRRAGRRCGTVQPPAAWGAHRAACARGQFRRAEGIHPWTPAPRWGILATWAMPRSAPT